MKRIYCILIVVFTTINVLAQDNLPPKEGGFIGTLGIGTSVPVGPLNIGWRAGLYVNANAGYLFTNSIGGRVDLAYNYLATDAGDPYSGGKFHVITAKGEILFGNFKRNKEFMPYLLAGGGVSFNRADEMYYKNEPYSSKFSNTEFGVCLGSGGAVRFSKKYSFFSEFKYTQGFGRQPVASFITLSFGVMMTP